MAAPRDPSSLRLPGHHASLRDTRTRVAACITFGPSRSQGYCTAPVSARHSNKTEVIETRVLMGCRKRHARAVSTS